MRGSAVLHCLVLFDSAVLFFKPLSCYNLVVQGLNLFTRVLRGEWRWLSLSILKICTYPDPVLRNENKPVKVFDDELRKIVADMFETMYAADGIGLAGPQIGLNKQIIVIDYQGEKYTLINPEIIKSEGSEVHEEGCLSFPRIYVKVPSPVSMTVVYKDEFGNEHTKQTEGFLTTVFSHEIDHLRGRMLIDRVSPLKRSFMKKKIEKESGK